MTKVRIGDGKQLARDLAGLALESLCKEKNLFRRDSLHEDNAMSVMNLTRAAQIFSDKTYLEKAAMQENHLAITIADVSGKGIPAAFFMAISKTTLKNLVLTSNESNLANLVSHANNILRQDNTARIVGINLPR